MVSTSNSLEDSTSGNVELLDDIEEELVSLSLSLTSSKPSASVRGAARVRSSSLQDLPRASSCPAVDKSRRASSVAPPTSLWSRSRDSGVPLSGSCPSVCGGLLEVIAGLRAQLQERDETVRVLRESYVALLQTRASLENVLDQARLCSACTSRRALESSRVMDAAPQYLPPTVVAELGTRSHSPATSSRWESRPPGAVGRSSRDTDWSSVGRECSFHSDLGSPHPALSSGHASIPEDTSHEGDGFTLASASVDGKNEPQQQQSYSRNVTRKDEGTQELLLCCLDAIHVVANTALQRSETIKSSLLALSQNHLHLQSQPK